MATTVIGVYPSVTEAERAVDGLVANGFSRTDVSIFSSSPDTPDLGPKDSIGAEGGTGAGAAIGGLAGFTAGIVALAIPGLGPLLAVGPLAAGLVGASVGMAAGGVVGALKDRGVPDSDAQNYSEAVGRGNVLVTLDVSDERADEAVALLDHYGAMDVREQQPRAFTASAGTYLHSEDQGIHVLERAREREQRQVRAHFYVS